MALTPKQLAFHAARALERSKDAVLAYSWPQPWTGGNQIEVDGASFVVARCESVLELREQLAKPSSMPRVLLVSMPESELGQDVLARIYGRRLLYVDRWQMIEQSFGTHQIDPRLYSMPWVADALLDIPIGRIPAGNAVLTYEQALALVVSTTLALPESHSGLDFGLDELLSACEHSTAAWKALASEKQAALKEYLRSRFGSVVVPILGAVTTGHAHAVISIGLACELLYAENAGASAELRDARVRLEKYLDGHRLAEAEGRQWAVAAERVLNARSESEQSTLLRASTDLVISLGAGAQLAESSLLPSALDARLEELGAAIHRFLRKPDSLGKVEQASEKVCAHRRAANDGAEKKAARLAAALCRREAECSSGPVPSSLVPDYLANGAWEDYARRALRGVRPEGFAGAVSQLLDRLATRRRGLDQKFASTLAECAANGEIPAGTLPIERALSDLVAPLAQQAPIVVIVLDGMSWDVYYGFAEDLASRGWEGRSAQSVPPCLLATVPSVTEFSRASLLSGRLTRGSSSTEKAAFSSHPGLMKASRGPKAPVLLHKAELVAGNQLSEQVLRLLADPEQQVVGVVLNAVDDALAKSEQVRIDWSLDSIPLLSAILTQAQLASRAVVLTSDHGHVLEAGSILRAGSESERWRSSEQPALEGEHRIGGPRVLALTGADIVVPWDESIRYGIKKNGYHGGVARQEVLVPFGIWAPSSNLVSDYPASTLRTPEWWSGSAVTRQPIAMPESTKAQPDLFAHRPAPNWIAPLLSSAMMAQQRSRIGRVALDDDRLSRLLGCLERNGGRATSQQLALAIEQPLLRMRGIVSSLQRMLNVDGYAVITIETATNSVIINRDLLSKQFEL